MSEAKEGTVEGRATAQAWSWTRIKSAATSMGAIGLYTVVAYLGVSVLTIACGVWLGSPSGKGGYVRGGSHRAPAVRRAHK